MNKVTIVSKDGVKLTLLYHQSVVLIDEYDSLTFEIDCDFIASKRVKLEFQFVDKGERLSSTG
jgi:hypothetical protein